MTIVVMFGPLESRRTYDFFVLHWFNLTLCLLCSIEMAEGLPPNHEMNPMRAMRLVPNRPPPTLTEPKKWSPLFNDFIARCLTKGRFSWSVTLIISLIAHADPEKRPDCFELLKHPFFATNRGSGVLKERINECFILKLRQQANKKEAQPEIVNDSSSTTPSMSITLLFCVNTSGDQRIQVEATQIL